MEPALVALSVAAAAALAAACAVALGRAAQRRAIARERTRNLATLGRFAAQMAHDLKNPLAVATGAAQFLKEEHARGNPLTDYGDFLDLMVEELDRMRRRIEEYQRLGRVEVRLEGVDLNAAVASVLGLQRFASAAVKVRAEPGAGLARVPLDRDLVESALTNLVANAIEAMPEGGDLVVRTAVADARGGPWAEVTVADTGVGMDEPTRERAFESFYTTKPAGSGLGLAFVRRVTEAHGGSLTLTSRVGEGTVVTMKFPMREAR